MRVYTTKPNARRAARRQGTDPELVREVPGGFAVGNAPAPTEIEKQDGEADLATLAWLYDCSVRQIEILATKGIAVRVGRGRFNVTLTTRNYVRHLREQAAGRVGQDPTQDGVAASIELKQANAQLIQLRLRRESGDLVAADQVRDAWGRVMRGIRQFVLALPGKIVAVVPTLSLHDRNVIEQICRDGLEDASMERGFDALSDVPVEDETHVSN
jgi:phage terminase Nu1 subunit (DNA packaging protein)